MKIKISNLSSMPIYQQIASEIRNKILSNELMSNTQLPSIRALSKELEVGIITIKKAYEVLLQENLIYSKGAVGYFVNEINREEILVIKKGEYLKEIEKVFEKALDDGLTKVDVKEIIEKYWGREIMVIKLNNLEVQKGSLKLGVIDYTFDNGYVYAITGNSGSGKTLFLQSILGSIDIKKEMVLYNDLNFYENEIEIKSKYSYVADNPLFSDKLSVETIISKISKLDSRFNKQKCYEYLKKYNIYKHKKIYELSQGERKILLFGIGIFTDSQVLVLDNPLAGVGLIAKREMLSLIREYMDENKITIIVTEDPSVIQNLADYILVLKDGQIVIDEDVVELQDRYHNKSIEEILISILKGVVENE